MTDRHAIEACLLRLLDARAPTASICPSDVARALDADGWRTLMDRVRSVAAELARAGRVRITRGSTTLDPDALAGGPIRIRRGRQA